MTALYLRVLGPLDLAGGSEPAAFETRKTLALLAYLAVEKGSHRREAVADLFWPAAAAEDARSSLRMTIRRVRSVLGNAADAVLVATRDSIGLAESAPLDLDLSVLGAALHQIRAPAPSVGLQRLVKQAVALYRGPFLDDLTLPDAPELEEWLAGQRAHWLGTVSELLDWLSTAQMEKDDVAGAAQSLQRWVSLDPGEDIAWRRLIEVQLAQGNRVGARQAWGTYRRTVEELGVEPSAEMEVLGSQIGAGLQPARVAVSVSASAASGADELDPVQMPFVGRARELVQLRRAFARTRAGEPQVVVLEGEAGIGKTRLADEFLAWAASQGADVVRSRGYETTAELPYASLIEGLRSRLERENAPDDLLDDPWLAELSQLLPELRVRYPDLPPATSDPALGRHQVMEAVTRLWKALAARRPLVMFRDDWHWSDTNSRDLMRYALHRFSEDHDPALMIVAVSAEQLGTDRVLAQWMGGLARDAPTTRFSLERLSAPDIVLWVAALAGNDGEGSFTDAAARRLGEWLIDRAFGNPFQIVAAVRTLIEQGVLTVRRSDDGNWVLDLTGLPRLSVAVPMTVTERAAAAPTPHRDWGDAPDGRLLYGRRDELDALERWVITDRCREVAVLGIGGTGKTALAARLAREIAPHFEFVFWRSLRNALPIDEWLADAVRAVCEQRQVTQPENREERILQLIEMLRTRRCLLVLDNLETVLQPGRRETTYREGYDAYGLLLQRLGEVDHQSCLLITSREKPAEVRVLEGDGSPVRAFQLRGLGAAAGRALLEHERLDGLDRDWDALVDRYAGNPLALQVVGETIGDVFDGEIGAFLTEGEAIFGGIRRLLDAQFDRLSPLEQGLLYWLAVEREPVGFAELLGDLEPKPTRGDLLEALEALRRRSLLEQGGRGAFGLQPIVLEYVTNRLISATVREIRDGDLASMGTHALSKAQSKSYIRQSQERLLVAPILDRLVAAHGTKERVERRLLDLLVELRSQHRRDYAPGNLIKLLRILRGNLRGLDLSNLFIRQEYLRELDARDVSLAASHLSDCALADAFDVSQSVTFSPDGKHLAAGTFDGEVCVWQLSDWTRVVSKQGHKGAVSGIDWANNGRMLATGGLDGTVKLWEPQSGGLLMSMEGHTGYVWRVSFSNDGHLLASGSVDATIKLWETNTGRLLHTLQGHDGGVWGVALSDDASMVASASIDGTVKLWDTTNGTVLTTLKGHGSIVSDVVLTPDSRVAVIAGHDGTIRLWEVATGRLMSALQGHTGAVWRLALSADGRLLVSGGLDRTVRLWEISQGSDGVRGGTCLTALEAHAGAVYDVAITRDARRIASVSLDGTLRVSEVPTGKPVTTLQGYARGAWGLAWGGSGKLLASGTQNGVVNVWEVTEAGRRGALRLALHGHTGIVINTAFSEDGQLLATGSLDNTIRFWRIADGTCLRTLHAHDGSVYGLALSPDARLLISSGHDGMIKLWNVTQGVSSERPITTIQAHTDIIFNIALSGDGHRLASGSQDGTVKLWEIPSGRLLAIIRDHDDLFWGVAVSRDGTLVASAGQSGRVNLWEVTQEVPGPRLLATLGAHEGPARGGMDFTPDARLLVSGGADGTAMLWDVASRRLITRLTGNDCPINDVAVSPDGRLIASSGQDGAVMLWDPESGGRRATLRPDRRYERMDITGLTGVSEVQKMVLRTLGAVEQSR